MDTLLQSALGILHMISLPVFGDTMPQGIFQILVCGKSSIFLPSDESYGMWQATSNNEFVPGPTGELLIWNCKASQQCPKFLDDDIFSSLLNWMEDMYPGDSD